MKYNSLRENKEKSGVTIGAHITEEEMKYYLAIDLGASSGRHIVGYMKGGEIKLDEVYRFKTGMEETDDGLVWNIPRLLEDILLGIKLVFKKYKKIESLSIDTWGVDYVLMNGDKEITPYYAYRNKRNIESSKAVHQIIPFEEFYKRNGIQFAVFNTVYQLYDDLKKGRLEEATDFLMLPSYFIYKLTGIKTHEYTNESTGALLRADTKDYDFKTIDEIGLPKKLFGHISEPGQYVGELTPEVQKIVNGNCGVVLCATHDTASAFEAVDCSSDSVILSSGTWSLLGVKSKTPIINQYSYKANYTNEGGVGYFRILKNIMGMWVFNELKREVNFTTEYIDQNIKLSKYNMVFDINDPSLLSPSSMKEAILELLKDNPPANNLDIFNSVCHSLVFSYKKSIEELESIVGKRYKSIYIVGGGARNVYLNDLVRQFTNKNVVALPIEATALGNIKMQMKAGK